MDLPILFKMDKKGVLRYREISVSDNIIRIRSGVYKNRDSHQWKEKERDSQYYEGHGSYKTGAEVAEAEALSLWKKYKREEAMEEDMDIVSSDRYLYPIIPIELQKYNDLYKSRSLISGMYLVQAKLDGERCTVYYKDGDVKLFSRRRKEKPHLEHIKNVMKKVYEKIPSMRSFVFDGEIIDPTGTRNTGRSSMSTKEKHPNNDKMILYLFGLVTGIGDRQEDRWKILERLMSKIKSPCLRLVPVYGIVDIHNHDDVMEKLQQALGQGYEGITLSHMDMSYPTTKDRSQYYLKLKPLDDEEAVIVGAHEGIDEHKGLIVFEVDNGSSTQFITPSWSHEKRREAMNRFNDDSSSYIGSMLTVRYRCKNEYGNYVEAVGLSIRDPET